MFLVLYLHQCNAYLLSSFGFSPTIKFHSFPGPQATFSHHFPLRESNAWITFAIHTIGLFTTKKTFHNFLLLLLIGYRITTTTLKWILRRVNKLSRSTTVQAITTKTKMRSSLPILATRLSVSLQHATISVQVKQLILKVWMIIVSEAIEQSRTA